MLTNYVKIAFRSLIRSKVFSAINIIGLAVGLASSFIILLYVVHELSYDRYNKKLDNIYIITTNVKDFHFNETMTPYKLATMLKEQFPEINKFARYVRRFTTIKYKNKIISKSVCAYVDPYIFDILTLPIIKGSVKEFYENKNSVILSEEEAKKDFGSKNPVGKILTVKNRGGSYEVKVAGVMKNIPKTSTFKGNIILPLSLVEKDLYNYWHSIYHKSPLESRNLCLVNTYLLLNPNVKVNNLKQKLIKFSDKYSEKEWKKLQFNLLPVKDIYFHTAGMNMNLFPTGNISNVYIYSTVGFLILLIACINIIILNTGRASTRAKEIGVRKVIGAGRASLVKQILTESVLVTLISLPIAVVLVELFLPTLSLLLGKKLPVNYFQNLHFIFMFICVTILVGIFSGSYISLYLSKLRPVDIMKNKVMVGSGKTLFRKVMVAVQMIIFIGLIISFITINKQMSYFHNKDLGFNKKNLIVLEGDSDNKELTNNFNVFKNELKTNHNIVAVSGGLDVPGTEGRAIFLMPSKSNHSKEIPVEGLSVDKDFIKTMGMKIIKGKSFAGLTPGELKSVCIINQAAVKQLGLKKPFNELIGKRRVIGIVKDFNMHSLREPIAPMSIDVSTKYLNEVVVRVNPANISQTIKYIQNISKKFNNGKPMDYQFFNDRIDELYGHEYKFDKMMGYFTGLAIFIACLGLFGMSLFAGQQRVKEIGIRKVMGASTGNVFYLLTKEFIVLTILSTVIAVPISVYFINKWLQNFAYHINISWWIYALSLGIALLIILTTVIFQVIKAATANPVKSLRYE